MLEPAYGTSVVFPCTDSRQSAPSLLELCQSHTTCSSIILTLAWALQAAASCHAAAAARQLLQLTGKGNDFLFVFPHQLEAEFKIHIYRKNVHGWLIRCKIAFSFFVTNLTHNCRRKDKGKQQFKDASNLYSGRPSCLSSSINKHKQSHKQETVKHRREAVHQAGAQTQKQAHQTLRHDLGC